MLTKSSEDRSHLGKITRQVERQAALSGGEAHHAAVPLVAARVLVVVGAEADDRVAPHRGSLTGHFPHQLRDRLAVSPAPGILDCIQERLDTSTVPFRLEFGHGSLFPRNPWTRRVRVTARDFVVKAVVLSRSIFPCWVICTARCGSKGVQRPKSVAIIMILPSGLACPERQYRSAR